MGGHLGGRPSSLWHQRPVHNLYVSVLKRIAGNDKIQEFINFILTVFLFFYLQWVCNETVNDSWKLHCTCKIRNNGGKDESWLCGTVVKRRPLIGELSRSHARPVADGWPHMWVSRPLYVSQLGQLSLSSFRVDKLSSKQLYRMCAGRVMWWVFTRLSRCGCQLLGAGMWQQFTELNPSATP